MEMGEDYISKVKNHIKNLEKRYSKLNSYFEKNWRIINFLFFENQ